MRIATWNVNSLRVRLELALNWLREDGPEVVCLQETKVTDDLFPCESLREAGYEVVFSGQKTYNGVAILSRHPIRDVRTALPGAPGDDEKRFIAARIEGMHIINVYVPNGQAVSLGGATTQLHEITRQILGFSERQSANETSIVLTATIQ